jgi:hypothetical protein
MRLFTSIVRAPLKVAEAIIATGRKTLLLASFGGFSRRRSQYKPFSPEQVEWYHWPVLIIFGLALDNLFFAVGLMAWVVLFYVIAMSWVALFGPIPPVHMW